MTETDTPYSPEEPQNEDAMIMPPDDQQLIIPGAESYYEESMIPMKAYVVFIGWLS